MCGYRERKRDSESMWSVKGNGRYAKDEERGKGEEDAYTYIV